MISIYFNSGRSLQLSLHLIVLLDNFFVCPIILGSKKFYPLLTYDTCVDVIGIWNQWIEQQNAHEVNVKVDEGKKDA